MLVILKQLSTHFIGDYVLISYTFKKIKFVLLLYIYIFIPLNPLIAKESKEYREIDFLVLSCYKEIKSCKEALFKINDYQKSAAKNKKFSCQTRLLGLEANLIMAMNSNFKRKEAKSIIDSIKKYC
ncbi:hypothetical protein [Prochlorococcus sp. MIT 0801]|uniref:hypothetical protein n=1 Tax=Prochlorococcus sp. MIT 0801 TaxID=1501269 RepID=UPI0004F8B10C|nr:hypothetical protein [Prochlorococcus sp. MIT 0801]AIQ97895.1 hypothetical protein EW15_1803 [Prochlorococcus sp. MIT 0801]